MTKKNQKLNLVWPTLATVTALAILVSLGTWQMQRKTWKDGLVASLKARTTAAPISLTTPTDIENWLQRDGAEYTKLSVRGTFDHAGERYLYAPHPRLGPGQHVYTPLKISNERVVWVNRGYVPQPLLSPENRAPGQVEGTVEIAGLARRPKPKDHYSPQNDIAANAWYWPDLEAMHQSAFKATPVQAYPFFVDALELPQNPGGWPKGGVTLVKLPNRHFEYALTWYGLAATLLAVYIAFITGKIHERRTPGRS